MAPPEINKNVPQNGGVREKLERARDTPPVIIQIIKSSNKPSDTRRP